MLVLACHRDDSIQVEVVKFAAAVPHGKHIQGTQIVQAAKLWVPVLFLNEHLNILVDSVNKCGCISRNGKGGET